MQPIRWKQEASGVAGQAKRWLAVQLIHCEVVVVSGTVESVASLTSADPTSTSTVTVPAVVSTLPVSGSQATEIFAMTAATLPPAYHTATAAVTLSVDASLSTAAALPIQSAGFQPAATTFTAFQTSVNNLVTLVATTSTHTVSAAAVTTPSLSVSISSAPSTNEFRPVLSVSQSPVASTAGSEFKPIFAPLPLAGVSTGIGTVPSTHGGFVFNPSQPAADSFAPQTSMSPSGSSLFQSASFLPVSRTAASSAVGFGINSTQTVPSASRTSLSFSHPGANLISTTSVTTAAQNVSMSAVRFMTNGVPTAASSSSWSSLPAFGVSTTPVTSAFPASSLFGSVTSASTSASAVPVQNSFLFQPNANTNSLFQSVAITSSSFPAAPNSNSVFGSNNATNSFAVRPDLINAAVTSTVTQPTFIFSQSQPAASSTLFPAANHGSSQPTGFGLAATSADTAPPVNPVFGGFGGQPGGATPGMFGAVTSSAAVAQNSFASPFSDLNQNAPSFGFQPLAVPSTFNFGKPAYYTCNTYRAPLYKIGQGMSK